MAEGSLGVAPQVTCRITIQPSSSAHGHVPRGAESRCPNKHLFTGMFIHKSQKVDTTQMSAGYHSRRSQVGSYSGRYLP